MTKSTRTKKKNESLNQEIMAVKKGFIFGTGRRKTAVARVFLYNGKGEFTANNMPIDEYFLSEKRRSDWMKPFHLVGVSHPGAHFNATVKIEGSGKSSQLDAVIHAFSHALASISEEYSTILRKQSMLTRDSRMVERKKPYLRKARKAPQYSKR